MKIITFTCIIIVIVTMSAMYAQASSTPEIIIIVDGVVLDNTQLEAPPVIINGRVLVSSGGMAYILDKLVDSSVPTIPVFGNVWSGISFRLDQYEVNYVFMGPVDEARGIGIWRQIQLDVPAQIINGVAMFPLRAPAEVFGIDVYWCSATRTVTVNTNREPIPFHTWPVNSSNWPEHLPRHEAGSVPLLREDFWSYMFEFEDFPLQYRFLGRARQGLSVL